ncbi:MAG TPA: TetR/AcrR family transcriptional regulator [Spirochaetota bacterium]|nr:TetR/AcrR family transcriptional regulator [Spirochaetota bacterium]HQO41050.1 TetR/AcrR family transcriptional regulator [Spirochaetota bacterium]
MKKRQNAELRKPDILKNYYQVILAEGVEGASIAKVAKRMKIHPSLIIHYFVTKDNMTVELVDYISKIYKRLFMDLKIETEDPVMWLDRLCDILLSEEWYNNTDISGDFSVISVSFRNRKIFAHLKRMYDEFISLITRELEQIAAPGSIKINDPAGKARLVVSIIEGYRHFKHFYIEAADSEGYRDEMKNTIKSIITG